MSDNKSELKFFLKIMAAYFGLYLIHFVIYPNTPLYNNSYIERLIWVLSVLLLPFFDIFILKSNISLWYNKKSHIFTSGPFIQVQLYFYFQRSLVFNVRSLLVVFLILIGCIIKFLWSSTIMKYTTRLWIGNIIIPCFTQKLNQLQNNLHQKRTTQI